MDTMFGLKGTNYYKTRKNCKILELSRKLANGIYIYIYCNRNEIVIRVTIRMYEKRYITCHGNIGQSYKHAPGSGVLQFFFFNSMEPLFTQFLKFTQFGDLSVLS